VVRTEASTCRSLLAEAELLMAADGYSTISDLTPDALRVRR
jgi:hypothetical protein